MAQTKKRTKAVENDRMHWRNRAQLMRVLGHPIRLIILNALCERSQCVKELNSLVSTSQAHFSQHMTALRDAQLIDCHANGPLRCYYILQPTLVKRMLRILSEEHQLKPRKRENVIREVQKHKSKAD